MIEERNSGNRLAGVYRGKVLQHMTHGYCKIMIHGVYPAEWENNPEMLPKAEQASPLFGGTFDGNGTFSYPNIGATVWCMFANGDQNLPIYFAASLGGQNAFGQHEIVKNQDEEQSTRHMVTSGKTHVEIFENGKLSSIVQTPDTRISEVKYNETEDGYLSADAVVARPIYQQIDEREISTINCQHVLDVNSNYGEISASTYYYVPCSEQSSIVLSAEQRTILSSFDSETESSTIRKHNDLGLIVDAIHGDHVEDFKYTDIDLLRKYNQTVISSIKSQSDNNKSRNANGQTLFEQSNEDETSFVSTYIKLDEQNNPQTIALSNITIDDNRTYDEVRKNEGDIVHGISKKRKVNEITSFTDTKQGISETQTLKKNITTRQVLQNDESVGTNEIGEMCKISRNIVKVNPNVPDENIIDTYKEKSEFAANQTYVKNDYIDDSMTSNLKVDQTTIYPQLNKTHIYKKKDKNATGMEFNYDNDNKIQQLSNFQYNDKWIINGATTEVGLTSVNNALIQQELTGMTLSSYRYEKRKSNSAEKETIDNDSSFKIITEGNTGFKLKSENRKSMMQFSGSIDTSTGIVDILIKDQKLGTYCRFNFNANGIFSIDASNQININTKNINVKAQAAMQIVTNTLNATANNVSIAGSNGDCVIGNVSLMQHKHLEMQSGDVVSPMPSQTAKGSN